MTDRYALILAHNRPNELVDVLKAIRPQVSLTWVIDNASEPPLYEILHGDGYNLDNVIMVRDSEQPPNLARLWNMALDQIEMYHVEQELPYKVAVLTDDVVIPDGWMGTVCEAMDRTGAAAGCSTGFEGHLVQEILKREPDSDIMNRMFGPAFVLRGEAKIRCDERLRWWWNDTYVDWIARGAGGMVVVPTHTVINRYPNHSTVGVLAEQAGRDGETFKEIWGVASVVAIVTYWVSLPWATFGLIASDTVVGAPPIATWTLGRKIAPVLAYYRKRGAEIR